MLTILEATHTAKKIRAVHWEQYSVATGTMETN